MDARTQEWQQDQGKSQQSHGNSHSAAMSGETLFKARATLSIPSSCNVTDLRQTLEKIAADLIVEISLGALPKGK